MSRDQDDRNACDKPRRSDISDDKTRWDEVGAVQSMRALMRRPAAASGAWLHSLRHATPRPQRALVARGLASSWSVLAPRSKGPEGRDRAVKRSPSPGPPEQTFLRHVSLQQQLAGSSDGGGTGPGPRISKAGKGKARPGQLVRSSSGDGSTMRDPRCAFHRSPRHQRLGPWCPARG